MRIWVTGSGGFLGRRLVEKLSGVHDVVSLSRAMLDLAAPDAIVSLRELGRPDVVVHSAASKPGPRRPMEFVSANVITTGHVIEALVGFEPVHIVYTSTLSVYGEPISLPVAETAPPRPTSVYALTKLWAEQLLQLQSSPVTIIRLPSLYGAGQDDSFVDGLARLALAGKDIELFDRGETIRDALFVDDAVRALATCATAPSSGDFTIINVGAGRPIKTGEYAEALVKELDSRSRLVPVDRRSPQPFDLYADISEARRRLAFEPLDLASAIRSYANELRAQR